MLVDVNVWSSVQPLPCSCLDGGSLSHGRPRPLIHERESHPRQSTTASRNGHFAICIPPTRIPSQHPQACLLWLTCGDAIDERGGGGANLGQVSVCGGDQLVWQTFLEWQVVLASGRATPCFQRTAPGQTHRRKPREKNPSTGCPIPPYHIRNLHRLPQFGAGAETDGIELPVSIPGLLDANGWLQKVLETVRLAGDALPLFSPPNRRSWKMTKTRGFSLVLPIIAYISFLHS